MNKLKFKSGDWVKVVQNDCPVSFGSIGLIVFVFSELRAIEIAVTNEIVCLNFDDVELINYE